MLDKKNRARTRTRLKSFVFLNLRRGLDKANLSPAATTAANNINVVDVHCFSFWAADAANF